MTHTASATHNASAYYLDRHIHDGHGGHPAIKTADETLTYGELLNRVTGAGRALRSAGVKRGDRVIMVHPDAPAAVTFLLAAIRIGAAPVPIATQLTDAELSLIYVDCQPTAAVTDVSCAERLSPIAHESGFAATTIVTDELWPELDSRADPEEPPAQVDPDEVSLLQYTSGSTGVPKGVVHLHRGLLTLPAGFGRLLALTHQDTCYSAAKMSFGYGLGNSVLFPMAAGATAFLRAAPSDPLSVFKTIQQAQPTVVFGGPTLYRAMIGLAGAENRFDLSSVRLYVSAGDALSPQLFSAWQQRFSKRILDGLGSTECLHIFMAASPNDAVAGELGTAIAPYEIRLIGDNGEPLPPGSTGELEVKGPANFARYWNRPAQSAQTLRDGWVRTGDVLHQHASGTFSYLGRRDDMFKVREMKVSPVEVEQVLLTHPAVAECAVTGRLDARGLPSVCAFVCLARGWDGSRKLEQALQRWTSRSLSPHKVPKAYEFVTRLPRTSTGKLTRHTLRT